MDTTPNLASPPSFTPVETHPDVQETAAATIQRLFRGRHARQQFQLVLSSVFEKFYDEDSGLYYYHNTRTGETTWEKPRMLKGEADVEVKGVYDAKADAGRTSGPVNADGTTVEDIESGEEDGKEDEEDEEDEEEEEEEEDGGERDAMGFSAHERTLAHQQFDHYDTDKSGSINSKELLKLLQSLGEQITLKNVEEMIQQVDENSNGEVEFEEFLMILRRQKDKNVNYSASLELALIFGPRELDNLKRQFIKLDLDGSGYIDEHELQALIKKLGRKVDEFNVRELLQEVDDDGSGTIGFNEFLQIVASMMKENGKQSGMAKLLALGIAQGVLNELNDVMKQSRVKLYEWWNADWIAEQKRLEAKRERRRRQEEERRRQKEKDAAAFAELQAQIAAQEAARRAQIDGLRHEILFAGDGLNYPIPGQYARVHYTGAFQADGVVFESTRKRGGALEFCVGAGHLIKGFDLALQRMSVGETAKFTMAPMLAYGVKGRPPKIPPNATLVFKIELITVKEKLNLALDLQGDIDD
ncbi:hypothetical protein Poli38472_012277 [Pythium oligandrum]|uniref:peptidylprolyl isomerase n=1 Tax=Pythium oligandrum TaxID=41045 RepID=A0A8K1CP01_PYTOL|nr:hypothetical protein Poli38472_012277 [Pythium oligandrum]|eukprot:TMW67161.1 hypothetical protein Poli38472_012277 [Pythium oligandrum]